ncbi:hypothetical protein ES705_44030 [subsurface metagenome]
MKKIYSKVFGGTVSIESMGMFPEPQSRSWLLQDDIEVIGAELALSINQASENDGYSYLRMELSQTGNISSDGQILEAVAGEYWNTAPPFGALAHAHPVVTFPEGYAVPIKEEGYLYLNFQGTGKSAGTDFYNYKAIVYYTKGNPRRK